jgi:hypothetical protein
MMTQDRDYEDILRDALRAAAESVEPASDGLERVRHRLHSPRSARSVLARAADWLRLYRIRLSVRLESFRWELSQEASEQFPGARSWPAQVVAMTRRATTPPRHRGRRGRGQHAHHGRTPAGRTAGWLSPAAAWFRPALAVAGVVAVVAIGVFALNRVQQTEITPTNSVTSPGHQRPPAVAGSGTPNPGLSQPVIQPGQQGSATSGNAVTSSPTCTPTPTPSKTPRATTSASATPTPTPSDTGSATPSVTPSGSGSPWATPTNGSGTTRSRTATPKATTDVMLSPDTACGGKATPKATGTTS